MWEFGGLYARPRGPPGDTERECERERVYEMGVCIMASDLIKNYFTVFL